MTLVNGFNVNYDITGQRFYFLSAIKPVAKNHRRQIAWEFVCDCGNITIAAPGDVKRGHTKSCGCYSRSGDWQRKEPGHSAFISLWCNYNHPSRARKGFELTKEEFRDITKQNCHYCGIEPHQISKTQSGNGVYIYNGIDRANSSKGYTLENSVPCCKLCNVAKNNMTREEFLAWIERVYFFNK